MDGKILFVPQVFSDPYEPPQVIGLFESIEAFLEKKKKSKEYAKKDFFIVKYRDHDGNTIWQNVETNELITKDQYAFAPSEIVETMKVNDKLDERE
jgi:hypothetical protein